MSQPSHPGIDDPTRPDGASDGPPAGAKRVGSGEAFVWLTGMGLVIGLAMIASLLGLILYKGMQAFWPYRIAEITLTEAGAEQYGVPIVVGHLVEEQEKRGRQAKGQYELRVQTGNRECTAIPFRYIDRDAIESIEYPPDVKRIERMEYGIAIGWLESLQLAGQEPIPATDPTMLPMLDRLIEEAIARRHQIERLEKGRIGAIADRMQRLRTTQRRLERQSGDVPPDAAALASIEAENASLQSRYEEYASEARTLREMQEENSLSYRIADGRVTSVPIGELVYITAPNKLGFFGRLGVFLHNMKTFVWENPREANTEGGVFPAIFGTFVMTLILSVVVTPFGVVAAIYLREYAREGPLVRIVRIAINNLAGVPSIVFGVFGLGFFVYVVGGSIDNLFYRDSEGPVFGTGGIFWASLTLALMTVPVVIVATEEALAAVTRGVREGSLACGASKWQTIQRVVLPAAAPGIITGMILAMARGAGEVAPLMITGVVKLAPSLPLDTSFPFLHLDRKFMHLGFHIYDLGFQSPDSDAARPMVFATTLLLIVLVVTMNFGAIVIRERLRRKYSTGAF